MYSSEVRAAHQVFAALFGMGAGGLGVAALSAQTKVDHRLCQVMCADLVRKGFLSVDDRQLLHLTLPGRQFFKDTLSKLDQVAPTAVQLRR
ncbi:hypothetical protein [Deinococcus ficus]|uniref:ArnR1-like winged helix-turn-helix domain-containing protein n=1 Tax=Deinococcus ficus TaxID=317577 RepID=A0A221T2W2_9DEIO|nr:hypothetical protein [Deinococcus ficus]ASN83186.1 hypothetical protein DFI_18470 [Deinococcus ficus]